MTARLPSFPAPSRFARAFLATTSALALAATLTAETAPTPASPLASLPPWVESTSWAFAPARDEFSADALVDLRSLNERVAGEHGRVRLTPDGNDFLRGDGAPLRFWAVNTEVQKQSLEAARHHFRFLAKRGVNMVRWHGFINPKAPKDPTAPLPDLAEPDPRELAQIFILVAAARESGVYVTLSPYWSHNFKNVSRWGYASNQGSGPFEGDNGKALLFFDARLQAAYRAWLRVLFTTPNPHTGLALKDDPALAIFQIQNEDSILHPSTDRLHPRHRAELAAQFTAWVVRRHGSLDAARAAWGADTQPVPEDDPAAGRLGLYVLSTYAQPHSAGTARRLADQLEFYATLQRDFHASVARYVREDLGCPVLINAGNWRTADSTRLYDAERWTYAVNEIAANNRYYHPPHLGPTRHWSVEPGDHFANDSVTLFPRNLPLTQRQIDGHPFLITESTWVFPNRLRAEGPLLVAAYSGLTGIDGYYWFNLHGADWHQPRDFKGVRLGADVKWGGDAPDLLAQFPAAALLHRRGDVTPAAPVVEETRPVADLLRFQPAALAEDVGFDPTRDLGDTAPLTAAARVPQLSMLTGPVRVRYTADGPASLRTADFAPLIDPAARRVRSATGQHEIDWSRGLFTLDTPRAQGFAGFLGTAASPTLRTSTLTLAGAPAYGTLTVVALDDAPLATSRRVLVQLATQARPTGWRTEPAEFNTVPAGLDAPRVTRLRGEKVLAVGGAPWRIAPFTGQLTVANPALRRARVCDANFLPLRDVPLSRTATDVTLALPTDALYLVLTAE